MGKGNYSGQNKVVIALVDYTYRLAKGYLYPTALLENSRNNVTPTKDIIANISSPRVFRR